MKEKADFHARQLCMGESLHVGVPAEIEVTAGSSHARSRGNPQGTAAPTSDYCQASGPC